MKRIWLFVLFAVFTITSLAGAAEKGKVAVASDGNTTEAKVSGVAARSSWFMIFDRDGNLLEAIDNPYKSAGRGAGASVVPFLARKGVTVVVAGEFGVNMIQAMEAAGIRHMVFHGSVEAASKKALEQ